MNFSIFEFKKICLTPSVVPKKVIDIDLKTAVDLAAVDFGNFEMLTKKRI